MIRSGWARAFCVFLLLPLFHTEVLYPQSNQGVQIRVESRLVLVDLIVTDGGGNFVADLTRDEVEIFEDKARREISSFELARAGAAPAERPVVATGDPAGKGIAGALPPAGRPGKGSTVIFVLDLHAIAATDLPQVKQAIAGFLKENIAPGDRAMLVTAGNGIRIQQQPTNDTASLLHVMETIPAMEDRSNRFLRFGEDLEVLLIQMKAGDLKPQFIIRYAVGLGRDYIGREEGDQRSLCEELTAFIDQIGTLPGRKNLVFFSSGYRPRIAVTIEEALLQSLGGIRLSHGESSDAQIRSMLGATASMSRLSSYFQGVVDAANRRRVSFYTVDAKALATREDVRFKNNSRFAQTLQREETNQPQGFLRDLAGDTGGRWFINRNDLQTGIKRAYEDSGRYYELGYVPEGEAEPGSLHKITVKVNRPNVTVRYRRSYVEPEKYDPAKRTLENAFKFPALFQDFDVEADTSFINGELKVDVFVPTRTLDFRRFGDRHRCELAVDMALFDGAGNLVGDKLLFTKTYNLELRPDQFSKMETYDNVTSSFRGRVKPGSYRLRIVVRQPLASKTATLEKRIGG